MLQNYFDNGLDAERPEYNDDYYDRAEHRPIYHLNDAIAFDRQYVNRILNYDILTDSDKQNLADTLSWYMYQLQETTTITTSFEDFCTAVMGEEWRDNMIRKWLQKQNNELATRMGLPEMFNSAGIFLVMPKEEDDE